MVDKVIVHSRHSELHASNPDFSAFQSNLAGILLGPKIGLIDRGKNIVSKYLRVIYK